MPDVTAADGRHIVAITYALNIVRATGAAAVAGRPQGDVDHWRGDGTCRRCWRGLGPEARGRAMPWRFLEQRPTD